MTPPWSPSHLITGAAARLDLPLPAAGPPLEPGSAGVDWVSALPLRLAAGDPAAAADLAGRLATVLAPHPAVRAAAVSSGGHLLLTLTDDALVTLVRQVPARWAEIAAPGRPPTSSPASPPASSPVARRRSLEDPVYRAQLGHARLTALLPPPDAAGADRHLREPSCWGTGETSWGGTGETSWGGTGETAYGLPSHEVLVAGADALRVADRLGAGGRPHHLTDWLARTGEAVVSWTREPRPERPDPTLVAALRDALASALRATGTTPIERL
ncbi:hypothetical protein [Arsenicicoccus sp. oral taxon 190]|uniref:hypothetical protein n=1 Tax=Arsenicicoccus sp. oral taxon 190 TaxID=1658671 RepID=UPI000679EFB4|nr:hypothetical protein [Arsenicicoccus sp. oral taxon 190]AKT52383.1 hypothetical protein ADJ73_15875 [Arsenicicoccus sp. oral taxon 190]